MWARLGRERLCPAGQEELPCACHVVLMPVLGMQRTGEHWFWGCTGNARGKAWQRVLVWAGDTPGWVCDSAPSPCQSGGRWMRKAAGGVQAVSPSDTAPALAQPGRGGWNQPPPGNDPAGLVTHTQLVTKANQKEPVWRRVPTGRAGCLGTGGAGLGTLPASGWTPVLGCWQAAAAPQGYPGMWVGSSRPWEEPAASRGPASGDQNVTLPQECPAQWRGRGGRLPSCQRLIAYKVPYKHIVSRISCFRCRGGLHNAPPACSPALSRRCPPCMLN